MITNLSSPSLGHLIGRRDAKQLAKSLYTQLRSGWSTDEIAAKHIIEALPLPSVHPLIPDSVFNERSISMGNTENPTFEDVLTSSGSPWLSLGHYTPKPTGWSNFLSFSTSIQPLGWTHQGALRHGLMLGYIGSGQDEVLMSIVAESIKSNTSTTLIHARGDLSSAQKLMSHAKSNNQQHLVRFLNFCSSTSNALPGTQTHTYNPFAAATPPKLSHIVLQAISPLVSCPPIIDEKSWPHLLKCLMDPVAHYAAFGRDHGWWPLDFKRLMALLSYDQLQVMREDSRAPAFIGKQVQEFFDVLNQSFIGKLPDHPYDVIQNALINNLLSKVDATFGHVLNAKEVNNQWLTPDLTTSDMLDHTRFTIVVLPVLECFPPEMSFPAHLFLADLAYEIDQRSKSCETSSAEVKHLLLAAQAGLYLNGRTLEILMERGRRWGLSCLLAAPEYAALSSDLLVSASSCGTKFLMRSTGHDPFFDEASRATALSRLVPPDTLQEGVAYVLAGSHVTQVTMNYTPPAPIKGIKKISYGIPFVPSPSSAPQVQLLKTRMQHVLMQQLSKLPAQQPIQLSWCQQTIAQMLGYAHWHELEQRTSSFK